MVTFFTLVLLVSHFSSVVQAADCDAQGATDDDYDTDTKDSNNACPTPKYVLKSFAALPIANDEVALELTLSNTKSDNEATIKVNVSETTQLTKELSTINITCQSSENVTEVICRKHISAKQCANLLFEIKNANGEVTKAKTTTIPILPGTVVLDQLGNQMLLKWSISCSNSLMPVSLYIESEDGNKTMSLDAHCKKTTCVVTIAEENFFQPCVLYSLRIGGYSDKIPQFFHWSTSQALRGSPIVRYSNQSLVIDASYDGMNQKCLHELTYVNASSSVGGYFQPRTIPCISTSNDSAICSDAVQIPDETFICQSNITISLQSIFGKNNHTVDSGIEHNIGIEKPADWDGGKTVRNLQVKIDEEDVIIEWSDPLCIAGSLTKLTSISLLALSSTKDNQTKEIPGNCSEHEGKNKIRLRKGKLVCNGWEENIELKSCLNYSLSITTFGQKMASVSTHFTAPFQALDIKHFTSKSIPRGIELQWKMPQGCPSTTELTIQMDNSSYSVRPFDSNEDKNVTCQAGECHVTWTFKKNVLSCSNYSIQIGSAHVQVFTSPDNDDYSSVKSTVNFSRKNESPMVIFTIDSSKKRCLRYLNAIEVHFGQSNFQQKWVLNCSHSQHSNINCSHTANLFGFLNACKNHTTSYRPIFKLTDEKQIWNSQAILAMAKPSKLLRVPEMSAQSGNLKHVSVKWRDPSCLYGNIVSWDLSIQKDNKTVYSAEIPYDCSKASELDLDKEYRHRIIINGNVIKCDQGNITVGEDLELNSCTNYSLQISPYVKMHNNSKLLLKEFKSTQNIATIIDPYDVQELDITDINFDNFNVEVKVPANCSAMGLKQLTINGEAKTTSLAVLETINCSESHCSLKLKEPLEAAPNSNYTVRVGYHSQKFTTPRERIGRKIMDELRNSTKVTLVDEKLNIVIMTRGCSKNCEEKMNNVTVKFHDAHTVNFTFPCHEIPFNRSEISTNCSETIPIKAINGCRALELQIKPEISGSQETLDWKDIKVEPFVTREANTLQVEAIGSEIEISWRFPVCLITSHKISSWNLKIKNATHFFNFELPNHCTVEKTKNENKAKRDTQHSMKIQSGKIECDSHKFSSSIQVSPCAIYSATVYPVLDSSDGYTGVPYSESATFSTFPDLDIQVINASAESFEIAFTYPQKCSKFAGMDELLKRIRIPSNEKTISLTPISEEKCAEQNCKAHWQLNSTDYLETSSSYSISIGTKELTKFFTLPSSEERTPKDVTVVKMTEIITTIEWSKPTQNLMNRLICWQVRVTNEKGQSDIKNVSATKNTFDIHIPNLIVNFSDRATSQSQQCPLFYFEVGAVWPAGLSNQTVWTEPRPLNNSACQNLDDPSPRSAESHKRNFPRISNSLLIALCVTGGILLVAAILIASVHFARKTGYWQVKT